MIVILNYGIGNFHSILNVYKYLGIDCQISKEFNIIKNATHLILPGVGSFDKAILAFKNSGLKELVEELIFEKKIPILGICVGMQMMASKSDEGNLLGLKWIKGSVKKFDNKFDCNMPIPHMGWNFIENNINDKINIQLRHKAKFYFLHSYYFLAENKKHSLAECEYINTFDCIVKNNNIYGVQFHPEKSHGYGVSLLNNFSKIQNVTS